MSYDDIDKGLFTLRAIGDGMDWKDDIMTLEEALGEMEHMAMEEVKFPVASCEAGGPMVLLKTFPRDEVPCLLCVEDMVFASGDTALVDSPAGIGEEWLTSRVWRVGSLHTSR